MRKGNNKTCTSLPQTWGHPSAGTRKKYGPKKLADIRVKKANSKVQSVLSVRQQQTVDRSSFDPRSLKDRSPMHFTVTDWRKLAVASNGNCGILLYKNPYLSFAGRDPDVSCVAHEEIVSTETIEEPMPLIHQAKMVAQVYPTVEEQCEQLVRGFTWSSEQSNIIAEKRWGQSCNSTWALYRVGIITASRLLSVLRKTDEDGKVKDQQSTDNLTIQILGYNKEVKTKAMNWGLMNEPIARKRYKVISQKCHSNFSVSETGIVLSVDWPYIGASPDAVVQCSCCGPGAAEFKVTWTHREKTIREFAQVQGTCLHIRNGNVALKHTHEYFYQVQTVMAVLKVSYVDFFLLTSVDEHLERIDFDRDLWQQALPRLFSFFQSCIVPEIFTKRLFKQQIVKELIMDIINKVVS